MQSVAIESVTEFLRELASRGVKLSAEAGQLNCYAPNGALTKELREGILRWKPEILALLEERGRHLVRKSPEVPAEFPLSSGQKGLYILQQINPEMTAYNLPLCVRITGELDVERLEKAWSYTLDQYPILTARIVENDGALRHRVDASCRTTVERHSVDFTDAPRLIEFLRQCVKRPFNLDRGPLGRIDLVTLNERERILLLTIHHMIFDGVSAVVLLRSVLGNYWALSEGRTVSALPEGTGYADFVAWEEAMLASAEGQSHADYWQQRLAGELPTLELFPDLPRRATPSFEGASVLEALPAELSRAIRDFAREQSVLPSIVFLAAFKVLLHRYANQDDIIVGMPVMVRPGQKFAQEIGYFINMVPLRTQCSDQATLSEFLRDVRKTMLDAIYHSAYPFELMLDKLRTKSSTKNAVFQVNFAYQNFVGDDSFAAIPRQPGIEVENVAEIGPEGYSDLGLEIFEKDNVFRVHVRYNPDVYPTAAIERFCRHYAALLQSITESGDRPLREYSMLPEQERQKLLVEFNATDAEYPKDKCIHDFFAEQVALQPQKTAAVFNNEALTYAQLFDRTTTLAAHLQSLGIGPDDVVGLCLGRSLEMMIGIMGTVQAGGAYLPLDPDYPDDRLTYMLQDSNASVVLTQERFRDRVSSLVAPGTTVICLDTEWERVAVSRGVELRREVGPRNVCYVIYTSGSTGKPKGALVEHQALVNRIHWMQKEYQLDARDVVLQKTPYSFDVSVWEFFWPMMTGAAVVFAVPDGHKDVHYLESLINAAGVTTLHFVPSMLRAYLDNAQGTCPTVRQIFASGEALDRNSVDRYLAKFPNALLHNLYGPTEAAIDVTYFDCSMLAYPFVPIGKPIDNIQLYILDRHNQPLPIGVAGELHIAGDGLARGYLNRPELTQEKFVANPFTPGTRMYKTGDLACWMDDGNIQYLGRIDTQVKIRGFRVEIGEIEVRLNQFPGVQDSAVIARGEGSDKQLVAFYRAEGSTADQLVQLPVEELRAHLLKTMPEFMVPAVFVSVAAIPLSSNGKADRRALSRIDITVATRREYIAPRNETERQLVAIWAQVLNVEPETVGVDDNFFELGGHSLRAAQLISKIRAAMSVDVPLKAFFEGGSVAQMARLITGTEQSDVLSIPAVDRTQPLPLSFAQERLWFIHQLEPESAGYNVPGAVTIRGELDVEALERAFNAVIARHENLRTIFPTENGQARQQILDRVDFRLERVEATRDEAERICRAAAAAPFDLAKGPLFRGTVIRLSADEHILLVNMHHIVSDGWSIGVMVKEIAALMGGFELPVLPIQYADYAVWQRQWLEENGTLDRQLAYWQQKLAGIPESIDLPTDFPRPAVQSFAGARQNFTLDARVTAQLRRIAEQQGGTLYMALLAAFNVLLHRYTGLDDFCVGSPIAGRRFAETEGLIGMFVNTLAMRTRVDGNQSFAALLEQVKTTCLEAYEHQDAPFEKIVDAVRPQRNMAVSPIFQVMLVLQNVDMGTPDARIERYPLDSGISKFDLTFELTETPEGLATSIEYCTALYKPATIARMAEHFIGLCNAIAAAPAAPIRELQYLGDAEKRTLLAGFNDTQKNYPTGQTLHQLFIEQVPAHAGDVAVVCGDDSLTYQELYDRSRGLALALQSLGVGPDGLVGVCMERSLDMIVSMLGVLQAGGAYVPLDPNHPEDRLAYMVRDSKAAIVLTEESLLPKLGAIVPAGTKLLCAANIEVPANAVLREEVGPQHLSHVIYTSGSTGNPKGVAIEHHSPVVLVHWASEVYSREELSHVLAATSICFDLSVYEIFVTLANGGTIVLVPNALGLLETAQPVTLINTVPSAIEELVRLNAIPETVRTINLAGEPLPARLVDKLYDIATVEKVFDLYGPSEDTTYSTYILREQNGPQTIGRPLANTRVYILDRNDQLQPIGVPGELCISGDGLAREYLNRPELTAEKFVANPYEPGQRMYRTGDLARWIDNGTIQYLGRIDTQVKVRGFRIEMGEIEARLKQHAAVLDCAVIAQGEGASKQLIAFFSASEDVQSDALRAHLLRTLPDYMVPSAFVRLEAIPLNPNGKVDRRALSRIDVTMTAGTTYVAPRNATEQQLAAIWSEVLGAEQIGVHDNFFELGGHSLLATQLMAKIRTRMNVELPLRALFERTTVAQLAEGIAAATASDVPAIVPADRTQPLPLSYAQERLWFINELEPNSAGYNVPAAVRIAGELDVDRLEWAFNRIIERHESLRTLFPSENGQARQQILDRVELELERIDLSRYDEDVREAEAALVCRAAAVTPFELVNGPLLRGTVIRLSEAEHVLMLNMHHIISDGWSIGVLVNELRSLMEGRELPALPIQYADYAVWQRQWLEESGRLGQQLAYWQQKLAGVPESIDFPADFARPAVQSFAGATRELALDARLTAALQRIAEQQGGTLYMALLAAFNVLLHRYTGQNDFCVGSPIANRQYGETEGLVGMFVNTLALRNQVDGEDTFTAVLEKVKATCLEAYEHQDAPFEKVVDAVRPQRNMAISPIFQMMLVLQNVDMGTADQRIQRYPLHTGISKFDLTLELTETPEGLAGSIEYCTALYKPQTIARLAEHFIGLCEAIVASPAAKVRDLQYLGAAERQRLLAEFNDTAADYPQGQCLHQLFLDRVAEHANDTAVICGSERLTYDELRARSYDLALYLQANGVGPDALVGVCMERSLDLIVSLLGVLQAGGAYVPLDPNYPQDRLAYMVADSRAAIVLTQESLQEKLRAVMPAETQLIAVDCQRGDIDTLAAQLKAKNIPLLQEVGPSNLSHVIYTSGSTGNPKGVAIEHHSPVVLVHWASEVYSREELSHVLAATSVCFDLSVYEIFVTLANGGTIVLVPNALGLLETTEPVTLINTVPSAIEELVRMNAIPASVKTINLAGEPLPGRLVDRIYETTTVAKVFDLYGPSEDTTYSTFTLREQNGPQTIGRPLANTRVYILDRNDQLQPIGVPGELCISGDGLAREYLNRPELTAEKFVANPYEPGQRMYRTGDLARWTDDGTIQYLGRIDTQVKVRGFRIEMGEIEARLKQHGAVLDAAVIAQGEGANKQLVAFFSASEDVENEELRTHLLKTLPEFMVPSAFVRLEAIPLSPNGKVDRRALSRIDVTMTSTREYVAPRNETERQLAAIWSEVLGVEQIGVHDDFFELGGHSLSAVPLMAKTINRFAMKLPLATLFTAPTIAAMAQVIAGQKSSSGILVPIQPKGDATPLFAVPGAGGNVLALRPLVAALGEQQPLFALQAVGLDGTAQPLGSVEETAQANIRAMKAQQPAGPYRLLGYSYGGVVAYEMARILLENGEEVSSLILLDSVAPSVMQFGDEIAELVELFRGLTGDGAAELDLDRLRQSSDEENARYLAGLLNERGIMDVDAGHLAAAMNVSRANMNCYRSYEPARLSRAIDASLYRAVKGDDFAALPADYGWNVLLADAVRTHDVEATHDTILQAVRF